MTTATKTKKTPKQVKGLQIESLRPSLAEVERMIEYGMLDMPFKDIRITPVIQTQGQRNVLGHFSLDDKRWVNSDGKGSHEIQISAEHLARPAIDIYATVRHELIHALNFECGISDCSGNNYHNGKFKATAESYGLVCQEKTKNNGYGITTLDPVYAAQVLAELQPDDSAFTLARRILAARKPKAPTKMLKWSCGCTNIRAAVEVVATCGTCGEVFSKV